jgi:hypothetical protein
MSRLIRIALLAAITVAGHSISDTFYGGVATALLGTFLVYDVRYQGERP